MSVQATEREVELGRIRLVERRGARERRWLRISLGVGIVIIATVVLLTVLQPVLPLPSPNTQNYQAVLQPPSWSHPFGTDDLGRDILSRTLAGGRIDLPVALLITFMSVTLGVAVGALAGFAGGWLDSTIMRVADIAISLPIIVLLIAIVAIVGPGVLGLIIGVPLVSWAIYARLTRAEMLVAQEQEYMLAARVLGLSRSRILLRHALPNAWRPALAYSVVDLVLNILLLASLSFLGLGVQPPTAEWGSIISEGQQYLLTAWWISILPGAVVVILGIGFTLVGDAVADIMGRDLTIVSG